MIALLLFSFQALAADTPFSYTIEHVRFQEISERQTAMGNRQFIKLHNAQGQHVMIYDEESAQDSMRNLANLKQAFAIPETECRMELDCSLKAFCTAGCRSMYYEFSNSPAAPAPSVNRCSIRSFQCGKVQPVAALPRASQ